MSYKPVIKWSGSKRSQSSEIIKLFPNKIETYYEPFIGGGSMLMELLLSDIQVCNYVCSDINNDLIDLWNLIKDNPNKLIEDYTKLWHELNDNDDNKKRKKEYFNMVRSRFNEKRDPSDFMFIMRTCVNGMPRYNKKGYFNTSFHITRNGINPNTLENIICEWSKLLNENDVEFICQSYDNVETSKFDVIYLDPPYANTKGMYFGGIDSGLFFSWIRKQKAMCIMSYDGKTDTKDSTQDIPEGLFDNHSYLYSGKSSLKMLQTGDKNTKVKESLYWQTR